MPCRVRIECRDAIHDVMARANRRQGLVRDNVDGQALMDRLTRATQRGGWRVIAFLVMTNHLHLVLKTPTPNLSRGLQNFLSAAIE
jgi:REP element-mobilizing transposase RayT